MTTDESARAALSVTLVPGGGEYVTCHRYPDRGPILSIYEGSTSVTISTGDRPTPEQLCFAQRLAEAVTVFLAECERHTNIGPADPADSDAA